MPDGSSTQAGAAQLPGPKAAGTNELWVVNAERILTGLSENVRPNYCQRNLSEGGVVGGRVAGRDKS